MRGMRGILARKPHLPLPSSPWLGRTVLDDDGWGFALPWDGFRGTSNMWRVDLSDVHASMEPEGLKASEKTVAGSIPRLISATLAQLLVANTLMSVPCAVLCQFIPSRCVARPTISLAVARSSPSGLMVMARRGVEDAGTMLTFPVASWTTCR